MTDRAAPIRVWSVAGLLVVVLAAGCHEEPAIVIKFEPNDSPALPSAAARADAAARPVDAAGTSAREIEAPKAGRHAPGDQPCQLASDCALEPVECCDCANGGKLHAISKKRAGALAAEHVKRCRGVACTMMLSTDPSCGQRPGCVRGQCVLVAPPGK